MKPAGILGWTVGLAAVLGVSAVSFAQGRGETTGISRPSEERKLAFSSQGLVMEVPVQEGDIVKTGQVLLHQDDEIDRKELERLEMEANSNTRIEAAAADMEAKKVILVRREKTLAEGGANQSEVDEARLDVVLREKQLQVAKEEQAQAKIKAAQQAAKLARLQIKSPFDGVVEKIVSNVGEWADPQSKDGAVAIVKNDPLYIEIRDLSTKQVSQLTIGQKLQVRYADDKSGTWNEAEIFFFSPVADAASDTQLVKLKMPNPRNRASGMQMIVKLPPALAAVSDIAGAKEAAR